MENIKARSIMRTYFYRFAYWVVCHPKFVTLSLLGLMGAILHKSCNETSGFDLGFEVSRTRKFVHPDSFVMRIAPMTQDEMEKYSIPASITAAQAIVESKRGKSQLAVVHNNFFGVKCGKLAGGCPKNHCVNVSIVHGVGDTRTDLYRKYISASASFRDHSLFLKQERYAKLFKLSKTDYKGWARGLFECGYATDPNYAETLIRVIEENKLYKLDEL